MFQKILCLMLGIIIGINLHSFVLPHYFLMIQINPKYNTQIETEIQYWGITFDVFKLGSWDAKSIFSINLLKKKD